MSKSPKNPEKGSQTAYLVTALIRDTPYLGAEMTQATSGDTKPVTCQERINVEGVGHPLGC